MHNNINSSKFSIVTKHNNCINLVYNFQEVVFLMVGARLAQASKLGSAVAY